MQYPHEQRYPVYSTVWMLQGAIAS